MDLDAREPAKHALYTAVGLGVLAVRELNVRRLEFAQRYGRDLATIERNVNAALEQVEHRMPEPLQSWCRAARHASHQVASPKA